MLPLAGYWLVLASTWNEQWLEGASFLGMKVIVD